MWGRWEYCRWGLSSWARDGGRLWGEEEEQWGREEKKKGKGDRAREEDRDGKKGVDGVRQRQREKHGKRQSERWKMETEKEGATPSWFSAQTQRSKDGTTLHTSIRKDPLSPHAFSTGLINSSSPDILHPTPHDFFQTSLLSKSKSLRCRTREEISVEVVRFHGVCCPPFCPPFFQKLL
jgi:hypothetical protein